MKSPPIEILYRFISIQDFRKICKSPAKPSRNFAGVSNSRTFSRENCRILALGRRFRANMRESRRRLSALGGHAIAAAGCCETAESLL